MRERGVGMVASRTIGSGVVDEREEVVMLDVAVVLEPGGVCACVVG